MRSIGRFRKGAGGNHGKICFATDVHGSDRCFRKFINAGAFYGVQYLILGGDITGKVLVPIEQTPSGYSVEFNDRSYVDLSEAERLDVEKLIRDNGQYPVVGERDELLMLADESHREDVFRRVVVESIRRWVELAEERLAGTGIRCFVTPGNDDYFEIDEALQGSKIVEFVEGRCVRLDEHHEMVTTGYSNITPWQSPRELPEPDLRARIDAMFADVGDPAQAVVVLHPPPYGTTLDQAPSIDSDFRVQMTGGTPKMASVGSTAVRDFILERQPLLGLHGHVHESKGGEFVGRTLCINPGSEYTNGNLLCALVTLKDHRVEYQFVTG
jgi:uncharacterized protein